MLLASEKTLHLCESQIAAAHVTLFPRAQSKRGGFLAAVRVMRGNRMAGAFYPGRAFCEGELLAESIAISCALIAADVGAHAGAAVAYPRTGVR